MKNKDEMLREFDKVIQYFIGHNDNEPKTEFCENVDKLIGLKANLANGDEKSESNCNILHVNDTVCDNYDPEIGFPTGNGKCKNCGKYHED